MPAALYQTLTGVRRHEIYPVAWSALYFFCLLCSYYVLRPVRDEMAIQAGVENLQWTFTATFVVMLAIVPVFGWAVKRFALSRLLPGVYVFFAANLLLFYALMESGVERRWTAQAFFVWVSVFNLFVVSVFWSFMADLFESTQAKRLFGLIAAGGSIGAVSGPLITVWLSTRIGPENLLLVSAGFLLLALVAVSALLRYARPAENGVARPDRSLPIGGSIFGGIRLTLQSPYLLGIASYIVLFTTLATFLYFEQARMVRDAFESSAERTRLFAAMDLAVNSLTLLGQVFVAGRVMSHFGLGKALAILPLVSVAGFAVLAAFPLLGVVVVLQVLRRTLNFFLAKPAREALYTVVEPEEKYKAKNFIDTVVYRGGDAASGWLYTGLRAIGFGSTGIALAALPLAAIWMVLGLKLGARHEAQEKAQLAAAAHRTSHHRTEEAGT